MIRIKKHATLPDDEDLDELADDLLKQQASRNGYQKRPEDYDKKTAKIGEYLLMGYTMLEECCDGTDSTN